MIAISTEVQKRIKKYYGRDSKIIFPPVSLYRKNVFARTNVATHTFLLDINYFLIVSRLVPYKKVDLAIKAFNKLGLPLVIVGTGSEEEKLKDMAKPNIKFAGYVSERELRKYYKNARALIFPQEEDFGIVAVEALAAGKPVVAFKKGGALDIIVEGNPTSPKASLGAGNGIFFSKQNVSSLVAAVQKLFTTRFSGAIITSTAEKFSDKRFKSEFLKIVNNGR
jgi:glycosyltransferase involved in cell wall biosynthesis